jgi:glycosyltransferase involved in cell wall biosynthesis
LLLGGGSLNQQIYKIITDGNALDKVHFAGQIPYYDLPAFYASADIYLSASHTDGSSVSLMEAMACGLPAIVSNIPGNLEWIEHAVHGFVFVDCETDQLAEAMLTCLISPESLPMMGNAARERAIERADWEKNKANMLSIYEKVGKNAAKN